MINDDIELIFIPHSHMTITMSMTMSISITISISITHSIGISHYYL